MRGLSYYILLILLKTGVIHLYSVIDIGSNTIRLVIYTLENGQLNQALSSKAASPTRPVTDNPKYTFRCWLLRLGFIGDEFATAREHLLKRLPGDAAWRRAS